MTAKRSSGTARGIRANFPTIMLLVFVLFFLFTARIISSPLLLDIEESLGLGHAQAASFFLFITVGYSGMMIFSGFVAAAPVRPANEIARAIVNGIAKHKPLIVPTLSDRMALLARDLLPSAILVSVISQVGFRSFRRRRERVKRKLWG